MLITVSPKQAGNSLYGDVDARLLDKISSPPDVEEWQGWQEYEKALTEHNKSRLMELIDQHALRADILIAHNISNGILAPIAFFSHTNPLSKRWRRQSISD